MKQQTSVETLLWSAVLVSVVGLLGFAYYKQYVDYLDPCPLCITQRLFYYIGGIVALIALLGRRFRGVQLFSALTLIAAAIGGIVTAGRQVWLQHLPSDEIPACGPGLQYWLENMPLSQTIQLLFKGDGNCAEVQWVFLGLSMGEWSMVCFVGLLLVGVWLFIKKLRRETATID